MTYSTGGLIQAADYNGFANVTVGANVNAIWGNAGSANYGYGQTTTLPSVAAAATVGATEWANLVNRISTIGNHTGVTITSRTAPVAGNIISVLSDINTDLTNLYNSRANSNNSGTQVSPQTGTWYLTTSTPNTAWTITYTHTVTFANTNAASWFFNSGGLLKIGFLKTSTGTVADTSWNTLANTTCGTIYLSGSNTAHSIANVTYTGTTKSGGTGTPTTLATTTGWYNLTTANTTIYDQYSATAPYTSDHIVVVAKVDSNTVPSVLTISTQWINANDSGIGSTQVITGGVANVGATTNVQYVNPETTNLSNTWGAITISATTVQT